jgi:YHS domain-containing protein
MTSSHYRFHRTCFATALVIAVCPLLVRRSAFAQPVVDNAWISPEDQEQLPLALGGYCVVTLRDRQQWQPGDARLAATFDGQSYRFASVRERDIFSASPQSYAPMLSGDCPVTLSETGKRVPGRLECGVLHEGRLSFFANDSLRRKFFEQPQQYDDIDLALGGLCPVSRRNSHRDVSGIPETATIHHGLRFFFSSAHERSVFLSSPTRYDGSEGGVGVNVLDLPLSSSTNSAAAGSMQAGARGLKKKGAAKNRPTSEEQDVILSAVPAMAGYCPVTLKQQGAWVRGRYEYRVDLGKQVFLTAGSKEKEAMLADPLAFMPVLGGDCPVTHLTRNERVRGSVFHAVEFEGRLFLLADADRKAAFKANPARFIEADVAEGGVCIVSLLDGGEKRPGLPEFSTWHEGKVYRFAGQEQKNKFLANPERYMIDLDK